MAVRLGQPNVDKMLRSLTAKQFMEWEEYARLEPFNELRADYRTASIVQMLANVNRPKGHKAYTLQDFLLHYELPEAAPRRQTWQEQKAIAKAICMAFSKRALDLNTS